MEPESFAEGNNEFAVAMYALLREQPGNLFFSPFSIRTALAMTYAGARGQTAAQMREVLRLAPSDDALHASFAGIIQRLNAAGGGQYEMAVANSLWGQEGEPFHGAFLELIARHYGGGMNLVDFCHAAEAARQTINGWVAERTRQKIHELIPPRGVDSETRLVLVNAVYFKGQWLLQFDLAATKDERFYVEDRRSAQVPLMRQRAKVAYMEAPGYQAVELPYRGDDLSMLVLLPEQRDGLQGLESKLSASMLRTCVVQMRTQDVDLFLPRFKIAPETIDLGKQLAELGMPLAFTGRADFSGMNGRRPPDPDSLAISHVYHKAFTDVNEEGTEAAAATAVVMARAMAMIPSWPRIFRADHPFLFAIRDRHSGALLFLGRFADPTAGG